MSVEIPRVTTCCGVSALRTGLLILAYLKYFANILVLSVCFVATWATFEFLPTERLLPSFLLLTIILLVVDVIFTAALIFGAHLENISLLHLYYRYGLVGGVLFIAQGSIWIVYFTSNGKLDGSPERIFIVITAAIFLLHLYFVILTQSLILKIKSPCESDL